MSDKNELEKTIEYALRGTPELKPEEKRKWLGEFRERVLLGLTKEQVRKTEAYHVVKTALQDPMAEMLILNGNIPMEINSKYMRLAKEMNREYKSIATDFSEAMGLIVASRQAVDREDVTPEIKEMPAKFKNTTHKELCSDCYQELESVAPEATEEFKKLNFLGKMIGLYCGACERDKDGGPLM
ncbi:MAG: YueI family protein [Clostridiaceae bacterium]|nr:YueI family protein [Clostridiaceae bacterium]